MSVDKNFSKGFKKLTESFEIKILKENSGSVEEWMDEVRKQLTARIAELIDRNPERLKWILYRIDVPEQKLMEALAEHPAHEAPGIMADLIIEREQAKARTREQYRSENESEENGFLDL